MSKSELNSLVDKRQPNGKLAPVFPPILSGSPKEEEYVARMIERDKEQEKA